VPTYPYKCTTCDLKFEVFQSIIEDPIKICPECGKGVKRLIGSGSGILFKGSGFYQTDYRSASYQKGAKKEKPKSSSKDSKSDSSSSKTSDKQKKSEKKQNKA